MSDRKKRVATQAVTYVENGMTLGLGSGSTVNEFLVVLADRVKKGLNVKGVPSSRKTETIAKELGIPLMGFPKEGTLDLAIDGADEVDPRLNLLKGGGGSLVREKIVASCAKRLLVMVDESKLVGSLGAYPLPVEVLPFGWEQTAARISVLGGEPVLRHKDGEVFISDNSNYILDCSFGTITDSEKLHRLLKQLVGVVETGLFVGMSDVVLVATKAGVEKYVHEEGRIDE
ncbi:ribose-5-phosphate isomerase RpiA [Shouchella shacheensis]|uniref:ribose-5-phosphate isomerase RpiA n=1 Tax=Shouchella shacheensis TaxID=1649580 RepID=UPI00073FFF0F|nr:ribose-5-phosphate isomerase RpiA [Shouchella shacheensis]